ncbi:MAG: hypothetical protein GY750_01525 [Lentisphaerae bacterium]|nr:hypothetical protein [Lentisphaerota bacterium]MCP4100100.1 hypothetical protein [Lentisphaerota bacterium]
MKRLDALVAPAGLALKQYAMDYSGKFPVGDNAAGFNDLIKKDYLTDLRIYSCPSTTFKKGAEKTLSENNSSYIYFGGLTELSGPDMPLVMDKTNNHDNYVNVLFIDGHVSGFNIPNATSCENIVNYIKGDGYKPEQKKILLDKAKKFDEQFGYK